MTLPSPFSEQYLKITTSRCTCALALFLHPSFPPSFQVVAFLPSFLLLSELTKSLLLIKYMNNVNLNQWGSLISDNVTVAISVVSDAYNTLEIDFILADIVGLR